MQRLFRTFVSGGLAGIQAPTSWWFGYSSVSIARYRRLPQRADAMWRRRDGTSINALRPSDELLDPTVHPLDDIERPDVTPSFVPATIHVSE